MQKVTHLHPQDLGMPPQEYFQSMSSVGEAVVPEVVLQQIELDVEVVAVPEDNMQ